LLDRDGAAGGGELAAVLQALADPARLRVVEALSRSPQRAPLYAWSLIWLTQDRHPLLPTLLRQFAETGLRRRWLEYDATRDWLPAHDQAELRRARTVPAAPGHAGQ
jgi:hypothetical protein